MADMKPGQDGYQPSEALAERLGRYRVAAATTNHALTIALRAMERAEQVLGQCYRRPKDHREIEMAREDLAEAMHIARVNLREGGR